MGVVWGMGVCWDPTGNYGVRHLAASIRTNFAKKRCRGAKYNQACHSSYCECRVLTHRPRAKGLRGYTGFICYLQQHYDIEVVCIAWVFNGVFCANDFLFCFLQCVD